MISPPPQLTAWDDSLSLFFWLDEHADGWGFSQSEHGGEYHCFCSLHCIRGAHLTREVLGLTKIPWALRELAMELYEILKQVPEGTQRNLISVDLWPEHARREARVQAGNDDGPAYGK